MEIVVAEPPMIEEIDAAFHVRGQKVIFTWGNIIYDPMGAGVSPALKAHESVHSHRQYSLGRLQAIALPAERIIAWWRLYIADPLFRYEEELAAHRAEYRAFKSWTKDRNAIERRLQQVAQRLAGPLYGGVTSYTEARRVIVAER